MLPKNKLRERRLARLRIFEDSEAGPFAQNTLKRFDATDSPFKAVAPSAEVADGVTRQVEPEVLQEWNKVAQKYGWAVPETLARAREVEA
jgi:hypothetical protein